MEFIWLSERKDLAEEIVDIKDKVFADDTLCGQQNDMFKFLVENGFDDVTFHGTYLKRINEAIIYEEDKVVGIIGYYTNDNENFWINWFGILPEYRGKGYGSKAIKELELWLKESRDAKYLRLYTGEFVNKTAFEMYKKLGYIPQKERFVDDGEDDIVIMGKSFTDKEYVYWKGSPLW